MHNNARLNHLLGINNKWGYESTKKIWMRKIFYLILLF